MSLPVLSIAQMREWEKATWASGIKEEDVIQRVGKQLAQRVQAFTKGQGKVLILAGKGHNGDDARAACSYLEGSPETILFNVAEPRETLARLLELPLNGFDLVVDALFGIGINRPLSDEWQQLISVINAMNLPILSVDVPSGLHADTGEPQGAAVRASVTLTVGAPKRGLCLHRAGDFVGRLEVAEDVGLLPIDMLNGLTKGSDLCWIQKTDFVDFPPRRMVSTHKGTYGHANIVAGSLGYHGAAVLAARAALKAQPGLVTLVTEDRVYYPVAAQLQAAMVHPWRAGQSLLNGATAILFGPGLAAKDLSPALKNELRSFWNESTLPVIADATALDWLPAGTILKNPLRVITPHPGEAARLLKMQVPQVQTDRIYALRELSRRYGNCWVVLKGHQTLIGRSEGRVFINGSGNPFLAQGGSGDVLAGYLAGLLAQPALQIDPFKTISFAVWQHGMTADQLASEKDVWTIEDLVSDLGQGKESY